MFSPKNESITLWQPVKDVSFSISWTAPNAVFFTITYGLAVGLNTVYFLASFRDELLGIRVNKYEMPLKL